MRSGLAALTIATSLLSAPAAREMAAKRGVPLDEASCQRILTCLDLDTLDRWFDRALNATALSSVFDDLAQ